MKPTPPPPDIFRRASDGFIELLYLIPILAIAFAMILLIKFRYH